MRGCASCLLLLTLPSLSSASASVCGLCLRQRGSCCPDRGARVPHASYLDCGRERWPAAGIISSPSRLYHYGLRNVCSCGFCAGTIITYFMAETVSVRPLGTLLGWFLGLVCPRPLEVCFGFRLAVLCPFFSVGRGFFRLQLDVFLSDCTPSGGLPLRLE